MKASIFPLLFIPTYMTPASTKEILIVSIHLGHNRLLERRRRNSLFNCFGLSSFLAIIFWFQKRALESLQTWNKWAGKLNALTYHWAVVILDLFIKLLLQCKRGRLLLVNDRLNLGSALRNLWWAADIMEQWRARNGHLGYRVALLSAFGKGVQNYGRSFRRAWENHIGCSAGDEDWSKDRKRSSQDPEVRHWW
jgi:hypothetical protein